MENSSISQNPQHEPLFTTSKITSSTEIDLIQTFRHMTWRKISRLRNGHTRKSSVGRILWVVLVVLLFLGMTGVLAARSIANLPVQILVFMFVIVTSYLIVQVSLKLRWFLYWLVITVIALSFYVNIDTIPAHYYNPKITYILIIFGCLEALTLFGYLITFYLHPLIVLHPLVNPVFFWSIKPIYPRDSPSYRFSYRTFTNYVWRINREFSYEGEIHELTKKPHGFGRWTDNGFGGEYLTGYWEDGIPVGPFKSNEYATGFSFEDLRIGFCVATNDAPSEYSYIPRPNPKGLTYGVSGVECSLTGKFFLDLPRDHMVKISQDLNLCLDLMCVELPDSTEHIPQITITMEDEHLCIPGFPNLNVFDASDLHLSAGQGQILVDGQSISPNLEEIEALIFIPGFNCPLTLALQKMGQMLALVNFPKNIKTFIFNWPAARIITYHLALKSSSSERTLSDFRQFVQDLHSTGRIKKFHLLGHSMGCRVLLNASKHFTDLFCELNFPNLQKPSLSTFTLINPEADLDAFTQEHYPQVTSVCNVISLYVDEQDGALGWAEMFSRQRMLGRYATSKLRRKNIRNKSGLSPPRQQNATIETPADVLDDNEPSEVRVTINEDYTPTNSLATIENPEKVHKRSSRLRLKSVDMKHLDFDLDCLDMTQLDANVHALRHSYFNINRLVLDDLRDVIVLKRRAKYRTNRLHRVDSNVFTFISAPSFLVNP